MGAVSKYIDDDKLKQWIAEAKNNDVDLIEYLYRVNGLLYIELASEAAQTPIIDIVTRKITAAFHLANVLPFGFCGFHICGCKKASSASCDFILPNGMLTNSLCVHYIACHRESVPKEQIAIINSLTFGEVEPTQEEIYPSVTTFNNLSFINK